MASPASLPPNAEPVPALLSAHTPRAIRDALVDAERAEFERRYAEEMEVAAHTLDLTGIPTVLDTYRKIADITQRQGVEAHRRMLLQVTSLRGGQHLLTVSGAVHKAEINARLGR
jgi:hypothetical protein